MELDEESTTRQRTKVGRCNGLKIKHFSWDQPTHLEDHPEFMHSLAVYRVESSDSAEKTRLGYLGANIFRETTVRGETLPQRISLNADRQILGLDAKSKETVSIEGQISQGYTPWRFGDVDVDDRKRLVLLRGNSILYANFDSDQLLSVRSLGQRAGPMLRESPEFPDGRPNGSSNRPLHIPGRLQACRTVIRQNAVDGRRVPISKNRFTPFYPPPRGPPIPTPRTAGPQRCLKARLSPRPAHTPPMTHAISYHSVEEFEADYIEALCQEAAELAAEHCWWRDPFALKAHPDNPHQLVGSSRLLHRYLELPASQPRAIEYRDDILMGAFDYLAIIEMLTLLSKEHEFEWTLSLPNGGSRPKPVGAINNGAIDPRLFDLIMPELEAHDITDQELSNEAKRQAIRAKYFPSPGSSPVYRNA